MISKNLLNQDKLEGIRIKNDQLLINTLEEKKKSLNESAQIDVKAVNGKIYLNNRNHKRTIEIPIEEKIYIEAAYIENNLINIIGNSLISF